MISIPVLLCCLLTLAYVFLMIAWIAGWYRQPGYTIPENFIPYTPVSIIIPARNEAANIQACIASVLANNYPRELMELIVVDDHSTDDTNTLVNQFPETTVRCISLSDSLPGQSQLNAYKKKAIETGIAQASGRLIVTTDADCMVPANWLLHIVALFEEKQPVMIAGAVDYITDRKLIHIFQSLDFLSMQGITAAVHALQMGNMCNGANLAFSKEAFHAVGGYTGVTHLASGDDYLLMMKMRKAFPDKIAYLKHPDTIVRTTPQPDWSSFMQQRIRWASKSGKYSDNRITAMLSLVYLFNLSLLVCFILGWHHLLYWQAGSIMLLTKIITEGAFLIPVAVFFRKRKQLVWFPFIQPLHILYVVTAGLLGLVGVYRWKGRKVR